jgi:opacity protein-like surface antigen
MKKLLIATTVIGSLLSSMAFAENRHSLSLEASKIDVDQKLGVQTYLGSDDKILPTVRYGYKFQLGQFFIKPSASYTAGDIKIQDTDGTADSTTISQLFTVEGDLGYNVTNKLSLFGTLGLAGANLERDVSGDKKDASSTGILFGFGAEYDVLESLSISAKYQNVAIDYSDIYSNSDVETDMNIIKVGVSYNF